MVDNEDENKFVFDFAKENEMNVWIGILEKVRYQTFSVCTFSLQSKQDPN